MTKDVSTRDIVYIALFAALMAAVNLVPAIQVGFLPVPITAQTLGVMLAGCLIGAKRGGLAILLFVLLVALGLPLLAGGHGGLGVFFGPTAGFIISWPFAAFVTGWLTELNWKRMNAVWFFIFSVIGGIGVVYLIGIPWLAFVAKLSLFDAAKGSLIFVPGDLVKAIVAAVIAETVRRSYPLMQTAR
ncbi:biotin transporter BioY [Kaistia dalseonensis]|uniref:Biotin transporter n=1 Tax=Kaistia dalseonensis TaxID=410840 RepID=A0ABU0HB11_9HYPH|nr:biotin transporter BioY [Kaistia dalseonensis]MCX5496883.1 biotin transporter BioY [Kaistia dalseonensis]MDQ0439509.1 biotin transport system substrate-specific component [Kaistia dalseonensis]